MTLPASLRKLFSKPYDKVSPPQAAQLVEDGAVLVDVREPYEWQAGHAPKARHIPLAQLGRRARDLPANRQLILVCRSGNRSARAAAMLAREGRTVSNLSGGMHGWARSGLPVVAKGGGAGRVA